MDYVTNTSAFLSEFVGTAILLVTILSVLDKQNHAPSHGTLPVALFVLVLGIGCAWGMQTSMVHIIIRESRINANAPTGYALNPARDLGPRLLTSMVGYGSIVYTFRGSVMRRIFVRKSDQQDCSANTGSGVILLPLCSGHNLELSCTMRSFTMAMIAESINRESNFSTLTCLTCGMDTGTVNVVGRLSMPDVGRREYFFLECYDAVPCIFEVDVEAEPLSLLTISLIMMTYAPSYLV